MSETDEKTWRKCFMRRVFFVFLFALTALVFTACSSSDDDNGGGNGGGGGQAPKDFSGRVIIPTAYAGYTVKVCADANNSNRCDKNETSATAAGDGTFSISTIPTNSLVAEFYDSSSTSSLAVTVSAAEALPVLIYTTPAVGDIPAESVTVSAFTTLAKNKIDLNPGKYNTISAADAVQTDIGISPFDDSSYTGVNATAHDKVSEIVADILDYIYTSFSTAAANAPAGLILALYNAVYDIVDDIVSDPSYAVDTGAIKSGIDEDAIEDADASAPKDWDYTIPLDLYWFDTDGKLADDGKKYSTVTILPANLNPSQHIVWRFISTHSNTASEERSA
jgi:hypothetical protein